MAADPTNEPSSRHTASALKHVLVIEDDPRLRAYAGRVLSGSGLMQIVGEAGSLAEAMPLAELAPDLVLLDLGLPDGHGQTFIEAVRIKAPHCKVLVFTVFEDRASVINSLRAGADGYILKDSTAEQLLAHVEATLAGETPISARAAGHLLSLVREDSVPGSGAANTGSASEYPPLSPRERELLEYLARGLSRKEAARVMQLSPYTVAEYVQGIYRKLQVRTRGEAVFEALQAGMIRLDSRS
jgi:DNA-binding NarL/FixJ family response regulator